MAPSPRLLVKEAEQCWHSIGHTTSMSWWADELNDIFLWTEEMPCRGVSRHRRRRGVLVVLLATDIQGKKHDDMMYIL